MGYVTPFLILQQLQGIDIVSQNSRGSSQRPLTYHYFISSLTLILKIPQLPLIFPVEIIHEFAPG